MTIWVNGIVAARNKQPYVMLSNENGIFAQLSMAEARHIALDMLQMAARTEMDSMLISFCAEELGNPELGNNMMPAFREYRARLDDEVVEHGRDTEGAQS